MYDLFLLVCLVRKNNENFEVMFTVNDNLGV